MQSRRNQSVERKRHDNLSRAWKQADTSLRRCSAPLDASRASNPKGLLGVGQFLVPAVVAALFDQLAGCGEVIPGALPRIRRDGMEEAGAAEVDDLPDNLKASTDIVLMGPPNLAGMSMADVEKLHIMNTLRMFGGNREKTAKALGIGARTLYRKLRDYGLR